MKLKSLSIRALETWQGKGEGYVGEFTTTSPTSEVTVRLSDEACRRMLAVAAEGITEAAHEQAAFIMQAAKLAQAGTQELISND